MALSDIFGDFAAEFTGGQTSIQKKMPGVKGGFAPMVGVSSAWNALSTTGKVAVGAGAGIIGTSVYEWLFGGKPTSVVGGAGGTGGGDTSTKKAEIPITINPFVVTTPTTNQYDYSQAWNTISNSPYASISNKKAMSASATANVTPDISVVPSISQLGGGGAGGAGGAAAAGTDFTTIAAILGVAFVAATYFRGKGK